jgi:5-methyltetrahydrofolate--homocysteine methyltransferase
MIEIKLDEINLTETLTYLGFKGNIPDGRILAVIKRCEGVLLDTITPRFVTKVTEISNPLIFGDDLRELLSDCEKAVFFCSTLGQMTDRLINSSGVTNVSEQLYYDALANAAIEQVCDKVMEIIGVKYPEYSCTTRFSPGYGDYPLALQPQILEFLDAKKRIGVTVNESLLMLPSKSVSAVFGLKKRKLS